jgi:hypothetical protein
MEDIEGLAEEQRLKAVALDGFLSEEVRDPSKTDANR